MLFQREEAIRGLRNRLKADQPSIGSWMQLPHPSVAEIMGQAGYDWIAVDMEHGSISVHQLPDLFRALELGGTLPLARLAQGEPKDCKQALDAGAAGVIVPMIESAEQLQSVCDWCCWPPAGKRGVGFSRANLFGKRFHEYQDLAQGPFMVAMIEHIRAVENLADILKVKALDAILIGPYDLTASMGITGQFHANNYLEAIQKIRIQARENSIPCGVHVVQPSPEELRQRIEEGYRFLAYSIDSFFLHKNSQNPI